MGDQTDVVFCSQADVKSQERRRAAPKGASSLADAGSALLDM